MNGKTSNTFTLAGDVREFLDHHEDYGYKNKSVMVEAAIRRLCATPDQAPLTLPQLESTVVEIVDRRLREERAMQAVLIKNDILEAIQDRLDPPVDEPEDEPGETLHGDENSEDAPADKPSWSMA